MSSTSERPTNEQTRAYDRARSVVFLKTDEPFGGLSNMAGGFPLHVLGTRIYTSEALYQACRFPHLPEVQRLIIGQASPMTAKMKSKPHRNDSRADWDRVRVKIMRWCLRVKLAQNWEKFSELLLRTGDRPIVEESRKDDFWGAKPVDGQRLIGMNVLGRLLMELREAVKTQGRDAFRIVEPPDIPDFLLFGRPIGLVGESERMQEATAAPAASVADRRSIQEHAEQASLFDTPSAHEAPAPAYIADLGSRSALVGDLKPYPVMKDSGVPWLGQIPEHWQVLPAFAVYRARQVKNIGLIETTVLSLSYGRIIVKPPEKLRGLVPESFETYQIADPGNIIVRTTDLQNDQTSLRVGHARHRGIITAAYMCLETKPIVLNEFGYQYLNAYDLLKIIYGFGSGLRQNLDFSDIKRMPVLVPPKNEQAAIVRFLDHADRRIRRYIRAKQKLIKLLEEQKQAIIHRAVTRGLDPNVRLKPSGVEWLGDVPEHWEVMRVKQVTQVVRGKFTHRPRNDPSLYDGPYPFVQTGEVARASKSITSFRQTLNERGLAVSKLFPAGTLVMTIAANIGDVAILDFEACFPDSVVGFVPKARVERDFLYYLFVAMKPELLREAPVNTQGNLNVDRIGARAIALPPEGEQQAIVRSIEASCASLTGAIDKASRGISLLREYRTCLIADVVTGKLDVRDAAARLPNEPEDLEPLDEVVAGPDGDAAGADEEDEAPEEAEA
jgi:type I restriction enzyme S subunit